MFILKIILLTILAFIVLLSLITIIWIAVLASARVIEIVDDWIFNGR